jgi:hypothetical protein
VKILSGQMFSYRSGHSPSGHGENLACIETHHSLRLAPNNPCAHQVSFFYGRRPLPYTVCQPSGLSCLALLIEAVRPTPSSPCPAGTACQPACKVTSRNDMLISKDDVQARKMHTIERRQRARSYLLLFSGTNHRSVLALKDRSYWLQPLLESA